jgi:hypothetical protein
VLDNVVEIKQAAKIEWLGKRDSWIERKLWRRIKKSFELKIDEIRIKPSFNLESFLK